MSSPGITNIRGSEDPSVKRARPTQMPTLPKLTGEIILEVFTHSSLPGNNKRLVELGRAVSRAAVTHILFVKKPLLTALDIEAHRGEVLSAANLHSWVEAYALRSKLRRDHNVAVSLDLLEESRVLFYSYTGGVYVERGFDVVREWITNLVATRDAKASADLQAVTDAPDTPPMKRIKIECSSPSLRDATPPRSTPRQPLPQDLPNNPLAPAQPNSPFLPLFNYTAQQRRVTVEYSARFLGPSHAGTWTVTCIVNGIEMGHGVGGHKQRAKEEAARQAYYAMGWAPHG